MFDLTLRKSLYTGVCRIVLKTMKFKHLYTVKSAFNGMQRAYNLDL